ncbi:MAG: hypothetical protein ACXVZJ_11755, partial [Terriglobales bacterium]
LLDFYKGRITNDQMDDAWPHVADDPALSKVFWAKWGLYSDLREEYIDPKLRRNYATAKAIHRCLMFLNSELEYQWVGTLETGPIAWLLERFNRRRCEINEAGDDSVWPFYRKEDYKRAWKQLHN